METEQKLKKLLNNMKKGEDPVSALINGLAERGLIGKRIAIDEMNITPKLFESIRKKVSNTEISAKNDQLKLTVSIGVSYNDSTNIALDELINIADNCLYRAKDKGRDTVCSESLSIC